MVAQGHQVKTSAGILRPRLQQVRVHTTAMQPPFASLDEAKQSFLKVQQRPLGEIYVGDTVTDVQLFYPTEQAAFTYQLSSNLKPGLDEQQQTANLLLDHLDGNTQIYRARGLLDTPIEVDRSVLSAVWTFFIEGIKHILEGPDHVLFVVCLVIGALSTRLLIWQVTGFTAGHSITLISGFFGWVPSGAWFIPSIETAIALSIIFAAITALRSGKQQHSMVITTVIGLVHGLGFSFMLREILQIDSGNLWQSLLAFNLGVEAGQIAIVLLLWPVISVVRHYWPQQSPRLTWAIAISCIAVASLWAGERLISLGDALA